MKNTREPSVFEILDKIMDFGNKYKIEEILCSCRGEKCRYVIKRTVKQTIPLLGEKLDIFAPCITYMPNLKG